MGYRETGGRFEGMAPGVAEVQQPPLGPILFIGFGEPLLGRQGGVQELG